MFVQILKGALLGIANILPGVSAGTLAFILGMYDKIITSINHFLHSKEHRRESFFYLLTLGSGVLLGVLGFSNLFALLLKQDLSKTIAFLFIMGLILGSIPVVFRFHNDMKPTVLRVLLTLLSLILPLLFFGGTPSSIQTQNVAPTTSFLGVFQLTQISIVSLMWLSLLGIITSITMLLPGISGSALLVSLGEYERILTIVSERYLIDGIFFGIGILVGISLCAKGISQLLHRFPSQTYYFILGLLLSSILQMGSYIQWLSLNSLGLKLIAFFAITLGFITSFYLSFLQKKRKSYALES